jgi:hypothetical protein
MSRWGTVQELSKLADVAANQAGNLASIVRGDIQRASATTRMKQGDPKVLASARAINSAYDVGHHPAEGDIEHKWASPGVKAMSYPNPALLDQRLKAAQAGADKARQLLADPSDAKLAELGLEEMRGLNTSQIRKVARAWEKGANKLVDEVQYAKDHFGEDALMETAVRLRKALGEQLTREHEAGKETKEYVNYLSGLYEGELWDDNGVHFGGVPALGKMYGKPKSFPDYYSAIEAGPFIPKSNNVADIAQSRILSGMRGLFNAQAFRSTLDLKDPTTDSPIAIEAEPSKDGGYQVPGGQEQRRLVYQYGGGKPLAVRKGYARTLQNLYSESAVPDYVVGKGALYLSQTLKHAGLLLLDTFHPARLLYYAAGVGGVRNLVWRNGWTALDFTPESMSEAADKGLIDRSSVDWAMKKVPVMDNGVPREMTNYEIGRLAIKQGLNVGKNQDALYKHLVDSWDLPPIYGRRFGIGAYNRFVFDKFTPSLMMNNAITEFNRLNQSGGNLPVEQQMRRITKDINGFYGNLGRQGLIKSPTARDILGGILLAPKWFEGLLYKEGKFVSRSASAAYTLASEGKSAANVNFGSIGKGMSSGLATMFLLTQALNIATRGKTTFQNPEGEHKLDAWIPDWEGGPGIFISPLSVFAEISHDIVRLMQSKPTALEAIRQIGENKLNPLARALLILATSRGPTGEYETTTGATLTEAAKQMAPIPISVGKFAQAGLSKVAPGEFPKPAPGAMTRQLWASAGIKTEIARTAVQRVNDMAQRYLRSTDQKQEPAMIIPTQEASYAKLRSAIRFEDYRNAERVYRELKKHHTDDQIINAMSMATKRPFTGSKKLETGFLYSLSKEDLNLYTKAQMQKQQEFNSFAKWVFSRP